MNDEQFPPNRRTIPEGIKAPAAGSESFLAQASPNVDRALPTGTLTAADIEREIQAKGLTAPRVTPQRIEEVISKEYYFTAQEGMEGALMFAEVGEREGTAHPSLKLLTFCVLVLKNGFTVTGESACASPENFNAELGRKIARDHAKNKIWQLEGYALRERLHAEIERQRELNSDGGI